MKLDQAEPYSLNNPEHNDPSKYVLTKGNVWDHVLKCIEYNKEADPVLNLAILFHDVGKPLTYTNTDKIRYLMHHEVGLEAIDKIAERLRMSNELRDTLKFVCKWHMLFHTILDVSDYKLTQLILHKDWDILYKASKCDDGSRGEELFDSEHWAKVDARIVKLKAVAADKAKFDHIRSAISGERVMKLKGIPPSRQVGEVIEKTLEYVINQGLDVNEDVLEINDFICRV